MPPFRFLGGPGFRSRDGRPAREVGWSGAEGPKDHWPRQGPAPSLATRTSRSKAGFPAPSEKPAGPRGPRRGTTDCPVQRTRGSARPLSLSLPSPLASRRRPADSGAPATAAYAALPRVSA